MSATTSTPGGFYTASGNSSGPSAAQLDQLRSLMPQDGGFYTAPGSPPEAAGASGGSQDPGTGAPTQRRAYSGPGRGGIEVGSQGRGQRFHERALWQTGPSTAGMAAPGAGGVQVTEPPPRSAGGWGMGRGVAPAESVPEAVPAPPASMVGRWFERPRRGG